MSCLVFDAISGICKVEKGQPKLNMLSLMKGYDTRMFSYTEQVDLYTVL